MATIVQIIIAVVLTEAITEIVTKSEIFSPFSAFLFRRGANNKVVKWFHDLLDCGYCFSVWVGVCVGLLVLHDIKIINTYIDWLIIGLLIHRSSNILHNIIDRTK